MLKTAGVAALVAAGTAWLMASLGAPDSPGVDPALVEMLEARLVDAEVRLDAIQDRPRVATLKGTSAPQPDIAALVERIEALENQLAKRTTTVASRSRQDAQTQQDPEKLKEILARLEKVRNERFEDRVAKIDAMPRGERAEHYYRAAMEMRKEKRYEDVEKLLRAAFEDNRDHQTGQEALYQIGWSRVSRGDHEGAREAWLEARDNIPRENYRHDYARFYAASQARRTGDTDTAARELTDLQTDLERTANPERETILRRTRAMLVTLGK